MIRKAMLFVFFVLQGCGTKEALNQSAETDHPNDSSFNFKLGSNVRSNEAVFLSATIENNELIVSCAPNRGISFDIKMLTPSCNLLGDEFLAPFIKAKLIKLEDKPAFGFDSEYFGIVMYDNNHATPGRIRRLPMNTTVEFK